MKTIINLLLFFISFTAFTQDICVPEYIIRNSLKEHEEYVFLKAEVNLKDSLLTIAYQRIEGKDQIIEVQKIQKQDYEGIVSSLRTEGLIKDEQILKLKDKNKKLTLGGIILVIIVILQLAHG